MAIEKSNRYSTDTQGNVQSSTPLVVIYKGINSSNISEIDNVAEEDKLYISTKNIYFDNSYYEPLLNKAPSVKQSIDTEKKNLRIQTTTIEISNTDFHGRVFSDYLKDINSCIVRIYYKSQSCKTLDDCLLLSQSIITKYKQRNNIILIETEDSTEPLLSKNIPELAEGTDYAFSDQLKPIPIVYGHVNKSPVRKNINPFESDSEGNEVVMSLICDSKPIYNILVEDDDEIYPMINVNELAFNELFNKSSIYIYDNNYLNIIDKTPKDYLNPISIETDIVLNENNKFFEFANNQILVTAEYFKFQEALQQSESLGGLELDSAIISRILRKFTSINGQKRSVYANIGGENYGRLGGRLYATTNRLDDEVYSANKWRQAMFEEDNYILQSEACFPFESDNYEDWDYNNFGNQGLSDENDESESSLLKNWNVPNSDGSYSIFNLNPNNYKNYIYNDDGKALCWKGIAHSGLDSDSSYVNWEFKLDDIGVDNKCVTRVFYDLLHYQDATTFYGSNGQDLFDYYMSGSIFWSNQIPLANAITIENFTQGWFEETQVIDSWRNYWNTLAPIGTFYQLEANVVTQKLDGYNNVMQSTTNNARENQYGTFVEEWNTVEQFKSIKIGQPQFSNVFGSDFLQETTGSLNYLHFIQDAFIEKPNEKDWYANILGRIDENILWTPFNSWILNTFDSDILNAIINANNSSVEARTQLQQIGYRSDFGGNNDTSGGDTGWLINCNPEISCDDLIDSLEFDTIPEYIWIYTHYNKITEYQNLQRTTSTNEIIQENESFIIYADVPLRIKTYGFNYKFIRMNHIVGTQNDWEQGFTPEQSQDKINELYISNGWKDYIYTPESYIVETPALVVKHLIENESTIETDTFDEDTIHKSIATHQGWKLGFTLYEQEEIKKVIQEISTNTKLYPKFAPNGKFDYTTLKKYYNATDVNFHITKNDVINYNFETTKLEDVYNSHEISYEFDYATEKFNKLSKKNTIVTQSAGIFDDYSGITKNLYQNMNNMPENWIYDINKLYNKTIEESNNDVEAKYIRSTHTVELFKKHLLLENINQHLIINLSLTNKYIDAEIGDIIYLDQLSDKTGLGYKYWSYEVKGGQLLYPFFMVTDINKSSSKIDIKLRRLHRLQYGLPSWLVQETILDPDYKLPSNYTQIADVIDDGGVYGYTLINREQAFEPIFTEYPTDINNEFSLQWFPTQDSYILNAEENSAIRLDVLQTQLYDTTEQNWNVTLQEKTDGTWTDYILDTPSFEQITYANSDNNYNGYVIIKAKSTNDTEEVRSGRIKITTNLGDTFTKEFFQNIATEEDIDPIIGDVNADGQLNVLDAILIVQHILGQNELTGDELSRADTNQDGGINILDVTTLITQILE